MKTLLFIVMALAAGLYLWRCHRRRPSSNYRAVDAIVPAYNEEPCLRATLLALLHNLTIDRVICVNDGSTDGTAALLDRMAADWPGRLIAVHQANGGKGSALMNGLRHVRTDAVFLTDADTIVPSKSDGVAYLLAEIERGAHAVGGIPSSALGGAGLLPRIRASVKLPMIAIKRTFQQLAGGAPFIISGACGMFRTDVLRLVGMSDRTKVEDLDLTWTLVARGYRVRHVNRCIVYPQECETVADEWRRWKRWIVGYAVCMRLHRRLLLTRFGLVSDIDDTVISTSLPRPLIAAWNTFVRQETTRHLVPGMAPLFRTLIAEHPGAPTFYLSTGAWNAAVAAGQQHDGCGLGGFHCASRNSRTVARWSG